MKRILPLLLIALLLTGCGSGQTPDAAVKETESAVAATAESVYLYDAESETEQQTAGAVRAYPLGDSANTALLTMAEKLLVVFDDGIVTALQGENGAVAATGMADLSPERTAGELIAWENGVLYFDRQTREVVQLDTHLREDLRVALPVESVGNPVLQRGGDIFYCTASEIRALNIQTGISRLVRQHSCVSQELTGSFFDDAVIGCRITDETGAQRTVYLYADTGEVIQTDTAGFTMDTWAERYFASHTDEQIQYVFGSRDTEPMCLYPVEETVVDVLPLNGAVGYTADETGLHLSFYDLTSGQRTSQVTLNGVGVPQAFIADDTYIWFTAEGILYRWDVTATQIAEQTVYTGQRYTRENPDEEGLAECQTRVEQLRQTYGLSLYIWEEAADITKDYMAASEYRVSMINEALNQIEALLQQFPEGFVKETGDITFYLVHSLQSGEACQQYWDGAACHVIMDSRDVRKSFLWGMGVAIDTKVLGNSREFDTWDSLNPKGFQYTYDYEANAQRKDVDKYLDAFVDQRSMSFPTEDRSKIFAYAILPEGAEYFTHDDLQDKLLRMCEAIREAYDLEKSTTIFPWEQYLEEPIAKDA